MAQKTSSSKKSTTKSKDTIVDIIRDLKEYVDKHPEIVAQTKRVLDPTKGPVTVDHIPIHRTVQVLNEIVMFKHKGIWSERVTSTVEKASFIIITVDLEIIDKYGNRTVRSGTGAASIYSRGRVSRDSGDNAVKTAHSNAIKKAAFFYELGIQMWEERDDTSDDGDIREVKSDHVIRKGGGTLVKSKDDAPVIKNRRSLTDEQRERIKTFLRENNLTLEDAWEILSSEIPEAKGDKKWLIGSTDEETEERVNKFIDVMQKFIDSNKQ